MTTKAIRPLAEYLAEIPDPRDPRGIRHPLVAILCLCCVALMCGVKNPRAIAKWWKNRQELGPFLPRLGFTKGCGPSQATLYRVLAKVTVEMLEAMLQEWAEDNLTDLPPAEDEKEPVSLDGKTLRGSKKQGATDSHLLSAFSQRLGVTLKQLGVNDKTNEIGAMPELLADLLIEGRVFTMDALHTQRETAQTIIDGGGDYVMQVKGNQPTLEANIVALFTRPDVAAWVDDCNVTMSRGHGRIETRTLRASSALRDMLDWPGQQQVFSIERRTIYVKTGEVREETAYGVTSLDPDRADAAKLQSLVQGQWSIENRSHYVRDVTFGEDKSQVRNGYLPQVMAALRNVVISLLRLLGFQLIPDAFDYFATHSLEALATIGC